MITTFLFLNFYTESNWLNYLAQKLIPSHPDEHSEQILKKTRVFDFQAIKRWQLRLNLTIFLHLPKCRILDSEFIEMFPFLFILAIAIVTTG